MDTNKQARLAELDEKLHETMKTLETLRTERKVLASDEPVYSLPMVAEVIKHMLEGDSRIDTLRDVNSKFNISLVATKNLVDTIFASHYTLS